MESRILTIPEALEILRRRAGEAEALDLQNRTLEYLETFAKCRAEEASRLFEALTGMGLKPHVAAMIVNIAPRSRDELRTILYGEEILEAEKLDEILGLVAEHCSEKE